MLKKISVLIGFLLLTSVAAAATKTAIFAGGCFWCMESDFDKVPGVVKTVSGYDGGTIKNPTYPLVSSGKTQYVESLEVTYDPSKVTYQQLLQYYWHHIDPTVQNAQFCDHGPQYRSVIFYTNKSEKTQALASLAQVKKEFPHVYTEVIPSTTFYPAEAYHQDYYQKNPVRYKFYRWNCGRDQRVAEVWHGKK
tara:strand:- start:2963 stop:3541 length:579 start_codon:yes stop_codon:yes gene_type:complete